MKIAIGSDHGGYPLNETIIADLTKAGHEIIDFGTHDGSKPDDYPDYARDVGNALQDGRADRGIIGAELARELVKSFVDAKFSGEERHLRRLGKVNDMEAKGV